MGVLDKVKNALFEVEYVEVEEPPKKEKKHKIKEKKEEKKPIAKKIVLPGKKEEKVEQIEEEELLDTDFEIRPKDDIVKEEVKESFKLMDDDDFKVDDYDEPSLVIEENKEEQEEYRQSPKEKVEEEKIDEEKYARPHVEPQVEKDLYHRESKPYGMDSSYNVPVHQYGTYERYEEKSYFKPSPIISPIYGILDKNYKKEEIKEKQEVRISSYSRSNVSVDDIRNKAYGNEDKKEEKIVIEVENPAEEDDNLMVDLTDKAKPEVKEVTVGDALEYFQDLGLEYNVDYVDASSDKKASNQEEPEIKEKPKSKDEVIIVEDKKEKTKDDIKEEKISETKEDDDNLFDLIDSMYQE